MIALLKDEVPRVCGHAAAALSNFVDGMDTDMLQPYLQLIIENCSALLINTCSMVKENIIACIASLADSAKTLFNKYYNEVMSFLIQMMKTHSQKEFSFI